MADSHFWILTHSAGRETGVLRERVHSFWKRVAGIPGPFYCPGYVETGKEPEKMKVDVLKIRGEMEKEGYILSDLEFSQVLQISARKMEVATLPEEYLTLLLPDMIREAAFRRAVNMVGIGILILRDKEALESGSNDNGDVGGIHTDKAHGRTHEAQTGVAAGVQ